METELEGDLKEIYDLAIEQVTLIVDKERLTPEHLKPLVLNIIGIVQKYSGKYEYIDGSQKKAMAINVLKHVIVHLNEEGQISDEERDIILISLNFFGGILMDLGKIAYVKMVKTVKDIKKRGCGGCFRRNC